MGGSVLLLQSWTERQAQSLCIGKSQTQHYLLLIYKINLLVLVRLAGFHAQCLQERPCFNNTRESCIQSLTRVDKYIGSIFNHTRNGFTFCHVPGKYARFIFVVQGSAMLTNASGVSSKLMVDSYAYLPPNFEHSLRAEGSATLVVFERSIVKPLYYRYASLENHITEQIVGSTDKQPLLETPGEVFQLRKLLPQAVPFDFNIHIMDFQPGDFLNVKEVHYNQHGLLLLEGQGIYRLGDSWYPVQAGDVIWMAPFVPQWYAALGKTRTRYLLYKDVNRNPL
ncbi:(S)-ureidoglycine aminohydrolase [Citrus sinensis]|uniref:(S)-ureidoglycine aminohydrolase n=1 Tax=Citrus sinensis TaxID=2711 RepID=A0ACB8LUH0_CITSI|nr:(S)-ureidoglycine aminohydrolase [Citrus sinensis]